MARAPRHPLFAVCAPGLEPLLLAEIDALGVRGPRARTGGVAFEASTRQLYAANVLLRTATRVVLRVDRFRARTFEELERGVRALDLRGILAEGAPVHVRATSTGSRLYHTGAIAERVERFVLEAATRDRSAGAAPGTSDAPVATSPPVPQLVIVRIVHDEVTISIDTSGEPLYKRGWRHEVAKAPLRETLAAAMILASGWVPGTPLVDPLCGSGTIPIEAALIAGGVPPGSGREFAFQRWPSFEPGTWASVTASAPPAAAVTDGDDAAGAPLIVARDRDAGAVAATERNAERAGVRDRLDVAVAAISDLAVPAAATPGWILTNPPYGGRIQGGHDLRDLYARFGDVVRTSFEGWSVGMLVADPALAAHTRLRFEERWRATNGGIPVHFLTARA
jgi:putative N6-adenine-specific DNA methylase